MNITTEEKHHQKAVKQTLYTVWKHKVGTIKKEQDAEHQGSCLS